MRPAFAIKRLWDSGRRMWSQWITWQRSPTMNQISRIYFFVPSVLTLVTPLAFSTSQICTGNKEDAPRPALTFLCAWQLRIAFQKLTCCRDNAGMTSKRREMLDPDTTLITMAPKSWRFGRRVPTSPCLGQTVGVAEKRKIQKIQDERKYNICITNTKTQNNAMYQWLQVMGLSRLLIWDEFSTTKKSETFEGSCTINMKKKQNVEKIFALIVHCAGHKIQPKIILFILNTLLPVTLWHCDITSVT